MKLEFSTYCSKENLHQIREFVQNALERKGVSERLLHQLVLAIDEACANAIIHGNDCNKKRKLQVTLKVFASKIEINISDVGHFSPSKFAKAAVNIDKIVKKGAKGGLGLHLMHSIMDKVEYYKKGELHFCRLTKRI